MTETTTAARDPHRETVELLPWLLNGSLEGEERRAVEGHLAECAECRQELDATGDAFDLYSSHLPPDVVMAYAEDATAATYPVGAGESVGRVDRDLVERHLEGCAACRSDVEMTRDSLAGLAADEAASGAAAPLPFRRPAHGESVAATPPVAATRTGGAPAWLPVALAASLLFAFLAGGGWYLESQQGAHDQRQLAELERELEAARVAADEARAAAGGGDTGALESLARYETQVSSLRAEMEQLMGQLESEEGRVAELEQQLTRNGRPAMQTDLAFATFSLDTTRGEGSDNSLSWSEDRPLVVFISADGSGLVRQGEPVIYRILDASQEVVAEEQFAPGRDSQGLLNLSAILYPDRLPAGPLTLVVVKDGEELKRFPLRR